MPADCQPTTSRKQTRIGGLGDSDGLRQFSIGSCLEQSCSTPPRGPIRRSVPARFVEVSTAQKERLVAAQYGDPAELP